MVIGTLLWMIERKGRTAPQQYQHIMKTEKCQREYGKNHGILRFEHKFWVQFMEYPLLQKPGSGAIIQVQRGDTNVQVTLMHPR